MLTAAVSAGLALGPVPAAAADGSDLSVLTATVIAPDGSTSQASVTLDELLANPSGCPVYSGPDNVTDNAPNGRSASVTLVANDAPNQGTWPLASVLGCLQSNGMPAPVTAAGAQAVVVTGDNGTAEDSQNSLLRGAGDFTSPSDFTDPSQVPVISAQNPGQNPLILYNRPARSASDVNFSDLISGAAPVNVDVYEGQDPLSVTITAPAQTTVTAGTPLRFAAQVSGGAGSQLAYLWSFGGGAADSSTQAPSVAFPAAGVYDVGLQVTDASGDVGQAPPLQVTVTARPATTPTSPTHATTTKTPSGTGTARTGPVTTPARSHPGTTTRTTTTATSTSTAGTPTTTASTSRSTSASASASTPIHGTPTTATTGGTSPPAPASPGVAASGAASASTAPTPTTPTRTPTTPTPTTPTPTTPTTPTPTPTPTITVPHRTVPGTTGPSRGELKHVSGLLIAEPRLAAPTTQRSTGRPPTAAGQPAALRSDITTSTAAVVLGAVIAALLLGLGVMREVTGPLIERLRRGRSGSEDL